jgi:hypothetical protein
MGNNASGMEPYLPDFLRGAAYNSTIDDGRLGSPFYPGTAATQYTLELRKSGLRCDFLINDILIASVSNISLSKNGAIATPVTTTNTMYGFCFYNVGTGARAQIQSIDEFSVYPITTENPPSSSRIVAISDGDGYSGSEADGLTLGAGGDDTFGTAHGLCIIPGMSPSTVSADLGKYYAYIPNGAAYKKIDVRTGAVSAWTASAGSLPSGSTDGAQLARFGYKWRERIALYGVLPNPNNIYFSRARNPNDWNYTATPDGEEAFNLTFADPITCSRPLDNDRVMIAAQDRIGFLVGDLALGGSQEYNPRGVGCWGHWAAASDDGGNLYFVSPMGGLYVIRAGTLVPEAISANRREDFFGSITSDDTIRLVWSSAMDILFIFKVASTEPGVFDDPISHLAWDRTTNSFWDITMPARYGPTAHCVFVDENGTERVLIGGWDGYIREIDAAANDDDGVAIDSVFDYTPMVSGFDRMVLGEVEVRLGEGSDRATVGVLSARSARDLVTKSMRVSSSVLGSQRAKRIVAHVGGSAVGVRVQSAGVGTRFSVESCRAWVEAGGFLQPKESSGD